MKKAYLEISMAKEKIEKTPLAKEQIVFWIGKFKDGNIDDPSYRRNMVDIFVNSVFLYDDKLVIAFNWKDSAKTASLAELESVAADEDNEGAASAIVENVLYLADFQGSHLDDCRPPDFYKPSNNQVFQVS